MPAPHDPSATIGVILGVGQSHLFEDVREIDVPTPYGPPSQRIGLAEAGGRKVAVLARRGADERLLPGAVPHRANIWALASLGVRFLITTAASSGLRDAYSPGTFVAGDQVIDLTSGRETTFFDFGEAVQLAAPELFDPALRGIAAASLGRQRLRFRDFGTTVVTGGPRFPTAAEDRWHAAMGADMVNMAIMPETALALELGLAVVNVSLITDRGAGSALDTATGTGLDTVRRRVEQSQPALRRTILDVVADIPLGYEPSSSIPRARIDEVLALPPRGSEPVLLAQAV